MKPVEFADIHQHVLWGLDDGSRNRKSMHALLKQDAEEGIRLVYATTHAYPDMRPFDYVLYNKRLAEANDWCVSMGYDLKILPGCEIHYCGNVPELLRSGRLPTLGDSDYALIEFSPGDSTDTILRAVDRIYGAGFTPILAHIERYHSLLRFPGRALRLRDEYDLIYQINCETIADPYGFFEKRFVRHMLRERGIDVIATDAHHVFRRPAYMQEAYEEICDLCGRGYARRVTRFGFKLAELK